MKPKAKPSTSAVSAAAAILGRRGGKIGGPARARKLTSKRRSAIAREGAEARKES